jgi:hypothetical protein
MLSNGCCIFAYLSDVTQQWIYMSQYVKHLKIIIDIFITSKVSAYIDLCMYVCIRGGLLQPLHLDPQWSIVLNPYDR